MKRIIFCLALLGLVSMAVAQNPSDLAKSPAVQETQDIIPDLQDYPEDHLYESVSNSLRKIDKRIGQINESDGSIYVIESFSTARPSNMSGFINSRNVAYNVAELRAKMKILQMAGEQITSGRGFRLLDNIIEGEDPDARSKATILQKAAKVVDKSLDQALEYLGVSEEEIAKMNQAKKEATYEFNFNQTTKSLVAGMLRGIARVRIAEGEVGGDDYQVSVCMKYSPEYQSLAAMISENPNLQPPVSKVKNSVEKIQNMPVEQLVGLMGAQVTFNSQGEMIVFGFGQQEVQIKSSRQSAAFNRAYSMARLSAVANIKNFVAEDIVATEANTNIEKLREYDDGDQAYFSQQKFEQAVESKESTLNIATHEIRRWKGKHPISGHYVAGYVVAWSPSKAQQAAGLKDQFQEKSKGAEGTNSSTQERKKTQKSKYIISGEEEDL